ncbi:MAG: Sapep family Mn(2+)-dependent dipeptidase [Anaerovoracaceae bacterium]
MKELIKDLKELISINSVSVKTDSKEYPFGKDMRLALDKALSLCDKYGMKTVNLDNMVGYAEIGEGKKTVGILVHLDIVPAGEGWNSNPFELSCIDGKLIGRGVVDDKGPAIAVIHGIKELIDEGHQFNNKVRIIFGQAEETGDWIDMEYYKEKEGVVDFGFTPDADFPAIYAEKGIGRIKIVFSKQDTCFESIEGGVALNMVPGNCVGRYRSDEDGTITTLEVKGKSAHGSTPEDGINAISKFMAECKPQNRCTLVDFFDQFIKMEYDGSSLGGYAKDEASGEITYNYGMIKEKDDKIELEVDVRFPVTCDIYEILESIKQRISEGGFSNVNITLENVTEPVFMDKDDPFINTLVNTFQEVSGIEAEPMVIGGGTYARAMSNIVAFGPMIPGRELTEHQPNEYIFEEDLHLAKNVYKKAIKKITC